MAVLWPRCCREQQELQVAGEMILFAYFVCLGRFRRFVYSSCVIRDFWTLLVSFWRKMAILIINVCSSNLSCGIAQFPHTFPVPLPISFSLSFLEIIIATEQSGLGNQFTSFFPIWIKLGNAWGFLSGELCLRNCKTVAWNCCEYWLSLWAEPSSEELKGSYCSSSVSTP